MEKLLEKVKNEYQEKLDLPINRNTVSKVAIYGLIVTFIEQAKLTDEYIEMLSKQDNTLDYLYQAYLRCRYNTYHQIEESLLIDQADFLAL